MTDKKYGWDRSFLLGSEDCLISNYRDLEKLDLVMSLTPVKSMAVQAGGNLGLFPKRMAQEFKAVYTFEPDPDLFEMLCRNATEKNIVKMQAALGCNRELVGTKQGTETHVHEGVTHINGLGNIPTLRVDDLGLHTCGLIYLDVEGYEFPALQGATATLTRCNPVVVCEMNMHMERFGYCEWDIIDLLRKHDYERVFRLYTDYVFIHRSKLDKELYRSLPLGHINGASYILE